MGEGLNKSIAELDNKLIKLKETHRSEEQELIRNSIYEMLRLDNQYNIFSLDRANKKFIVDAKKILYLIELINNDMPNSKMNGFGINECDKSVYNITVDVKDVKDLDRVISMARQRRMGIF